MSSSPTTPARQGPRRLRMRTIVLGLAALTVSGAVLLDRFSEIAVRPNTVLLILVIGAGVLLLGNGVFSAMREQRARAEAEDPHGQSHNRS